MTAWTEALGTEWFGDVYLADLGAYTGPWPPKSAAVRVGSAGDLALDLVVEVDLVVGTPNPDGIPADAFDGSYAADLYDAARFAYLGGSRVGVFTDHPGGGTGDLSTLPAGAHLFVVWYPGSGVTFGTGWTPGLTPEQIAPAGYASGASGPLEPDPATGHWSDLRSAGEIERLAPNYGTVYWQNGYNLNFSAGWFTGDGDVAAEAATGLADDVQADGLSSHPSDTATNMWASAVTWKGQQWLNGSGAQTSRTEIVQDVQLSYHFTFDAAGTTGDIDDWALPGESGSVPDRPSYLSGLHENLDYAMPPAPFGSGTDGGVVNYEDPTATHVGWFDMVAHPFWHNRWTAADAADGHGASGQAHAITGADFPAMGIRVDYVEGTAVGTFTTPGTAQKWRDWSDGLVLDTLPDPDLSAAVTGEAISVVHSTGVATVVTTTVASDKFIDVTYDDDVIISMADLPLAAREFAINFKHGMQDSSFTLPFTNYAMRTGNNTDEQAIERNFVLNDTGPIGAKMALPAYRYWSLGGGDLVGWWG